REWASAPDAPVVVVEFADHSGDETTEQFVSELRRLASDLEFPLDDDNLLIVLAAARWVVPDRHDFEQAVHALATIAIVKPDGPLNLDEAMIVSDDLDDGVEKAVERAPEVISETRKLIQTWIQANGGRYRRLGTALQAVALRLGGVAGSRV
ncbi:MAG TPA: hypothetical protein VFQ54_01615, partial [Thermomicrobiales bacterium]|nr:hypothetical protein [Thermomicrobiales bacterium]